MTEYPAHEALRKVAATSQRIGEFLEWLRQDQRLHLMRWDTITEPESCHNCGGDGIVHGRLAYVIDEDDPGTQGKPKYGDMKCRECDGTGHHPTRTVTHEDWAPDQRAIERILADYFAIDLNQIAHEKTLMLEEIRAANTNG